ncbi:hypothetical protein EDD85DRAFT_1030022 [Armillaria nabsnona]|nr:hypothetical protein EDD85DRAFT_1030022 [Armillaria nabsnona]
MQEIAHMQGRITMIPMPTFKDLYLKNTPEPLPRDQRGPQDIFDLDNVWFSWPDKTSCTSDIFMHPAPRFRSISRIGSCGLEANEVDNLPLVSSMMKLDEALQKLCGVNIICYVGALGHRYNLF